MKSRKRGARREASTQTEKLPEVKSVSVQIEELSVLIQDFLNLSHRVKKNKFSFIINYNEIEFLVYQYISLSDECEYARAKGAVKLHQPHSSLRVSRWRRLVRSKA